MTTVWPLPGLPVNVPVAVAATGAAAANVTLSTSTRELVVALLVVTVPVKVAGAPSKPVLQSSFMASFGAGAGGSRRLGKWKIDRSLVGALNRAASVARSGAVADAPCAGFRFICCMM